MNLVVASNNVGKLAEIKDILKDKFEHIYTLADVGIVTDIEETGSTFQENATIKAEYVKRFTPYAVLADDSGLCVDALGGAPNIYSARYSGKNATDKSNRQLLLKNLEGVTNRESHFCTCMVLILDNGEKIVAFGEHYGKIAYEEIGNNGFGYDSLFISNELNKTFAQATSEEKNAVSHRGRALQNLLQQL